MVAHSWWTRVNMTNEELQAAADSLRSARDDETPALLRFAMADVIDVAVEHQEECFLCESHLQDECGEFCNGVILAAAWKVSQIDATQVA